jgi:nitrate/TMAO reductase-like tetraheme cytochrome c subunit
VQKPTRSQALLLALVLILVAAASFWLSWRAPVSGVSIRGVVQDAQGRPVSGATVRVKTTATSTQTDGAGKFTLTGLTPGQAVVLTAWAEDFYIGGGKDAILPGSPGGTLTLKAIPEGDNPDYAWLSAFSSSGVSSQENSACQNCHADGEDGALPFPEWQGDAHALSTQNPRFLSMYLGTDLQGNRSPQTAYFNNRDYGRTPLRPDLSQAYYGPGYKLDFPDTTGNCATCHAPAAAVNDAYAADPSAVSGVEAEGISCDVCHKVWDVKLDAASDLPYTNMPGVLSYEFRRPSGEHQFFAGPYDDVAPGEDTYSPIQQQSRFCSGCHYGVFWDTVVYNSYGEWLESPYSDETRAQEAGLQSAKTCQDCHMPAGNTDRIAAQEKGGQERDPQTIFSHRMRGASDVDLLQNSLTMTASGRREGDTLAVEVTLLNDRTGHDIPTDSPLREMILWVDARDENGQALTLRDGPVLPDWTGAGAAGTRAGGDPAQGDYAGLPGKAYAKVLSELWTELSPSGAYWNQTQVLSDNRLKALAQDTTRYVFTAPAQGQASISVSLLYRRAPKQLMEWKKWNTPDIEMEHAVIAVP